MRGGNVPDHIFVAILPQSSLHGDLDKSSTFFQRHSVTEMNITLNGASVNGYPLSCKHGSPIVPFQKFLEVTQRFYNIEAGQSLKVMEYESAWLWAHTFEGEPVSQGWIGINFTLEQEFKENMMMVVWLVTPNALRIDKFHQIERVNL